MTDEEMLGLAKDVVDKFPKYVDRYKNGKPLQLQLMVEEAAKIKNLNADQYENFSKILIDYIWKENSKKWNSG